MRLERKSPCKVNLLLNILGRRKDGFHELETLFHPVNLCDELSFQRTASGIGLTCSDASLPVDSTNLVHRAASSFFSATGIKEGVRIHLVKKIPMAAGLGGGSGNAAATLLGLNELFGKPLAPDKLDEIAGTLGSDVNFFLQNAPALATGRGEKVQSLEKFPWMQGKAFLLIHPGFGISTAWAYKNLARFPHALNGKAGRAARLAARLRANDPAAACDFYNSLESPALDKYPVLALFQEFLREHGAAVALMSGSGSTTFAITPDQNRAETLREKFLGRFGRTNWAEVIAA